MEPRRVLLVDADGTSWPELASELEQTGDATVVERAVGVASALESFRTVDCVVSRYELPDGNGLDLLESVRQVDSTLPFVLAPANGHQMLASRAVAADVTEYLPTSAENVTIETLETRIEAALDIHQSRRDCVDRTEQLEAERDRFAALFENIPEPAIVSSVEAGEPVVREVNDAFDRVFGYDAETIVGENIDDFIVPPGKESEAGSLNAEFNEGTSVQSEVTRLTASGPREFRLHVVPLAFDAENVEGYAIYEDITEQKEREQALEGLHGAAANIVCAESLTEACKRTVGAAENILQFDLCEISLEDEGYLVPTASSEEMDGELPSRVSVEEGLAGKTYRREESYLVDSLSDVPEAKPQGAWQSALSVPIGEHGVFQAVAQAAGVFSEDDLELAELLVSHTAETLTRIEHERALQKREATLRRQNEHLEKFANVLSHDLRNPLNVAIGELELAMTEVENPHLDKVKHAHARMENLVEDVLTLARNGQEITEFQTIDIRDVARACFRNVDTKSADLEIQSDCRIRANRSRLQSLLENLVRNAVVHGGPSVTISVGRLDDGFYVEDDGAGIPKAQREAVLEAGYSTATDSTGIGLSIVKEAAIAHDWELSITEGQNGGARFEFTGVTILE